MRLVIPSIGRAGKITTIKRFTERALRKTIIVTRASEVEDYKAAYPDLQVVAEPDWVRTISACRRWIATEFLRGKRFIVFDDDLEIRHCYYDDDKEKPVSVLPTDDQFDKGILEVITLMDRGFVHGALDIGNTPSSLTGEDKKNIGYNERIMWSVFYSDKAPVDDIDWGDESPEMIPEDFHVNLQLLKKGYPNAIVRSLRVSPTGAGTSAPGGCSNYRTMEIHNRAQELLGEIHPTVVKVTKKETKTGPWAGKEKNALSIRWKKAFAESGKEFDYDLGKFN